MITGYAEQSDHLVVFMFNKGVLLFVDARENQKEQQQEKHKILISHLKGNHGLTNCQTNPSDYKINNIC